jgi:3',5'-cyclic AMP phosphodiesterase CpdA
VRIRISVLGTLAAALLLASATSAATRILAVGDFGVGGEREEATGAALKRFERSHPASYLVTLGDNDYTSGTSFEANWRASFGWLAGAGVRVAGTLGNHDYDAGDAGAYELEALGMPRRYYTRRAGNVQLFLLDSNRIDDAQTAWLEQRLSASKARWKVVVFHHPPYACGGHLGNEAVQDRWLPVFEQHGVQLVLSGHDHAYERFERSDGVTYVVHGGGGAPLYPLLPCLPWYPGLVFGRADYGFLAIVASGQALIVTALDLEGRRVDRVTIRD